MNHIFKLSFCLMLFIGNSYTLSAQTTDALIIDDKGNVNVPNGSVTANGNVTASGNVTANGNVTASGNVTANGNVTASGNVTTTTANGKLMENGNALLPKGAIILWWGTVAPNGWVICDGRQIGNEWVPDLRGRFVVGAGNNYSSGSTGGQDNVTLSPEQMPAHTHRFSTSNNITAVSSTTLPRDKNSGIGDTHSIWDTGSNKSTYSIEGNSLIGSTGGGKSFDNRPQYYALCYIMKL